MPRSEFFENNWLVSDPFLSALSNSSTRKSQGSQLSIPLMSSDLIEGDHEFRIHADLPGVEASDLDVSINGKSLVIKAERKHVHTVETDKVHSMERSFGKVQRSIRLPNYVDMEKIESKFKNGVLTITIPKVEPQGPYTKKLKVEHS